MSDSSDPFTEFLISKCDMSRVTAKKVNDGLVENQIDAMRVATVKAKDDSLRPILISIFSKSSVNEGYVSIVMSAFNDSPKDTDLAKKQEEVDAALKAAHEFREAVVKENKDALDAARSKLQAALDKVAPDANWSTPYGKDLMPNLDLLIKNISGLSVPVSAGNYDSDYELLTEISEGALRKASIFFPGRLIGERATKTLFNFQADVTKSVLSKIRTIDEYFSNNSVLASYKDALTQDGSANTITAEVGAFFGFGAVALTGSYTGSTASEKSTRVNTLTETHEAMGVKVQCVKKASFLVPFDRVILDAPDKIKTTEAASFFLDTYGTHVITTSQILGGLYVLNSTVTFGRTVTSASYTEALSTTLSASESLSGWGVTEGGIGKGSEAAAHDSSSTSAHAGGTTSSNDSYTATTTIDILGPCCVDAGAFRTSLNNGNRSWCFIENGLNFDKDNRDEVINQIDPVWKLFDLAGRDDEAVLLRATWLDRVINTDAIVDPNSFFSQLVYKKLHSDPLKGDLPGWTTPYADKLALHRKPPGIGETIRDTTGLRVGGDLKACHLLDRHVVGFGLPNHVLTRFQQRPDTDTLRFFYEFDSATVTACGVTMSTIDVTEDVTPAVLDILYDDRSEDSSTLVNNGWVGNGGCGSLERLTVRVPEGRVLTGFRLQSDGAGNIWYKYQHAQLAAGAVKFSYPSSEVRRSETAWNVGRDSELKFLDRHDVRAPDGSLLVGFHLEIHDLSIRYEYWHVPVSALQSQSLLFAK